MKKGNSNLVKAEICKKEARLTGELSLVENWRREGEEAPSEQ